MQQAIGQTRVEALHIAQLVLNQAAAVLRIPNRAPGLINLFARFFKQVAEFSILCLGGGEQLAHLLRLFIDSDCLKADRKSTLYWL